MNASDAPPPSTPRPHPRILLLEDDPVSAEFMSVALAALPAQVQRAASLAEARLADAAADGDRHDLWLFDARLPDGAGADLLVELRAQGRSTPALAHTAEPRPEERAALLAAGFVDVLIKPLGVDALQAAVRGALGDAPMSAYDVEATSMQTTDILPIWDDALALRALNGNAAHVAAMRGLFLQELDATATRMASAAAAGDIATLGEDLHRLRAACGFVGAALLAAAVEALREAPMSSAALAQFDKAARDTLSAAG
jgi:CheY-like chemotaxis protein/HPt (histidine-containing phosphotransfer) domain-containing protein